jgi:hypothetical protein
MTTLIVTLRNFAKEPKMLLLADEIYFVSTLCFKLHADITVLMAAERAWPIQ